MASGSVAITLLALDVLLVSEELNEKDCAGGAGVSTAKNLWKMNRFLCIRLEPSNHFSFLFFFGPVLESWKSKNVGKNVFA